MKLFKTFTIVIACHFTILAQDKHLSKKKVSPSITSFVAHNFSSASHIRYYQEIDHDSLFIEAVFKFNKEEYSLKFFKDSLIEEEIELEFKNLPLDVQHKIETYLTTSFDCFKILECQEVKLNKALLYELKIKGKKNSTSNFYDIYFDRKGIFKTKEELIVQPIPSLF